MSPRDIDAHAMELHRRAIIIDGHSDVLMSIADGRMRLGERAQVPDPATWEPPPGAAQVAEAEGFSPYTHYFGTTGQYDIPRLLEGGLTLQVCAIYLEDHQLDRALQRGLEMTWWLHREAEENPNFDLITTVEGIRRLKREGRCGGVLALEGFEALGTDLRFLDLYHKLGLRMASLTHNRRNLFADGNMYHVKTGGLTSLGKQAVQRMNELGIVIDLGHMSRAGFWEVLEITRAPVVVSHTSPSKLFPLRPEDSPWHAAGRDVSQGRELLQALARNGGVVGAIFCLEEDLDAIVSEIEFLLEQVGPDHIGLGSDLYGLELAPKGLEDMSKLPALTRRLVERGHSDDTILKILGENYMRVFAQVWGK